MKEDVKQRWVTALRTGQLEDGTPIKQTKGVLRRIDEDGVRPLCCLGVLSELAVKDEVIPAPTLEGSDDTSYTWTFFNEDHEDWDTGKITPRTEIYEDEDLNPAVIKWAGLDTSNPSVPYKSKHEFKRYNKEFRLSLLNDEEELTFSEIADLVEEHL